jgi:hypothetical protein
LKRGFLKRGFKMKHTTIFLITISFICKAFGSDIQELLDQRLVYNEIIEQAVAEVSKDSLRSYVSKLELFDSRKASSDCNKNVAVPWLTNKFETFGADSVYRQPVSGYGDNVIAIIKGQNHIPGKYCMVGASLDAALTGPPAAGADDNASGCAAVLEAVRVLKKFQFENTIRFVLFNAHEVGLRGSNAYATQARNDNDTIIGGLINFMMIGYSRTTPTIYVHHRISIAGNAELASLFKTTSDTYVQFNVSLVTSSDIMSAGDHASFWSKGYPAVLGCEASSRTGMAPNYHKAGDLLDNSGGLNDSDLMANCTKAGVATLAELAIPVVTNISHKYFPAGNNNTFKLMKNAYGKVLINFSVSENNVPVKVTIYSMQGRQINLLTNSTYDKGSYSIPWLGTPEVNSVYLVECRKGNVKYSQIFTYLK